VNVDWARADFPPDLADGMTSLREAAGDREVGVEALERTFVAALEQLVDDLRAGVFPAADWRARQVTTGRDIDLLEHDGSRVRVRAIDVDTHSGGLIVAGPDGANRTVLSGEIVHVRLPRHERIPAGV
jgi:biotin-(acetyl-CoA carboxylase) ligase